jgi:hypothetical protein
MKRKTVTIELHLDRECWRTNENLEDCIEGAISDNLDSLLAINVKVKNFKKAVVKKIKQKDYNH